MSVIFNAQKVELPGSVPPPTESDSPQSPDSPATPGLSVGSPLASSTQTDPDLISPLPSPSSRPTRTAQLAGRATARPAVPQLHLDKVAKATKKSSKSSSPETPRTRPQTARSVRSGVGSETSRTPRTKSGWESARTAESGDTRSFMDRGLEDLEQGSTAGAVAGAGVRFVAGVADVGVVKPVAVGVATTTAVVCTAAAATTLVAAGGVGLVSGWHPKGREATKKVYQVSTGFAKIAKTNVISAGVGVASMAKVSLLGIPTYAAQRAAPEGYKDVKEEVFKPLGHHYMKKKTAADPDDLGRKMHKAVVQDSGFQHVVNAGTGATALRKEAICAVTRETSKKSAERTAKEKAEIARREAEEAAKKQSS